MDISYEPWINPVGIQAMGVKTPCKSFDHLLADSANFLRTCELHGNHNIEQKTSLILRRISAGPDA